MARVWSWPTIVGLAVVLCAPPALASRSYLVEDQGVRRVSCKAKPNGLEPYIPDPATAKAIFLAVETARFPKADKAAYPLVDVFDKDGRWVVFRHSATVLGGGQLELEMSKCTGRIYRAGFGK
jgi:hypothetical protein